MSRIVWLTAVVALTTQAAPRVKLPIEVAGEAGISESATVFLSPDAAATAESLRLQVHGLSFEGMASVRMNEGPWLPLSNAEVAVAEPAKSYGGIGGGFATVTLTLRPTRNFLADGWNTFQFRFNRTNGIASGFRVFAFNLLDCEGRELIPPETFTQEDPNTWTAPFRDSFNVAAGRELWRSAPLLANSLPNAAPIRAHCSDCHTQDGRDLKYFNYSNLSIAARSRFHGLSEKQGLQIASYIRSLPGPNPGRPWNPPYQPGGELESSSNADWAAGAGLSSVLADDTGVLPMLLAHDLRPDANLNQRAIPISIQLPDWNHWLPRVHPLDFRPGDFERGDFSKLYETSDFVRIAVSRGFPAFFDKWLQARKRFLPARRNLTPAEAQAYYSAQLWQLVKTWEISQAFGLEESGRWDNSIPSATAPAEAGISNGPSGMGGGAVVNEYFNNAWYQLQVLLNDGNHRHRGRLPADWLYVLRHVRELERLSRRREPGRLLTIIVKAMQSVDPSLGPENYDEGWRPERFVDPRILVSPEWAGAFELVPRPLRAQLTERILAAWLNKNRQFPVASYFSRSARPPAYKFPPEFEEISGGKVWESAKEFSDAGVSSTLIYQLRAWGRAYTEAAQLYRY